MQRRTFLQGLLSAGALGAFAPRALAGDPSAFARGLANDPLLLGWRSVAAERFGPTQATVEGRLPRALAGTLYRNGPALFERAGFRYDHWFDGDGMVHGWSIANGRVVHRARLVETPKLARERREGRFVVRATGSVVPGQKPIRNNDDANTANTSVMALGGRLFALFEGGSAFEMDPDTLDTAGAKTWRADLAALPFSAHPMVDADGSVWNFGAINLMGGNGLLLWHLAADGRLLRTHTLDTPAPGYLHAFAMTPGELVFVLTPFTFGDSGPFFERIRFDPGQPVRIAVVPKADPSAARWFEADFGMVYHFGDAYRRGDEIRVRAVRHTDIDAARSPMKQAMAGHGVAPPGTEELMELRIDLTRGRAQWETTGIRGLEFPMFDAMTPAGTPARLYAPVASHGARAFDAVAAIDPHRGTRSVHAYGSGMIAEEHLFVPRPGRTRPDDGWLLGTVYDTRRDRRGLAVLDAQRLEDGPLATAWVDYGFPLGFHGTFAPA